MPERESAPEHGASVAGQSVLAASNISKAFGGVVALSGVGFDLRRGEIHALMGENGAGKSTLMKILSGVYTDYEGTVSVAGQAVRFSGVRDAEDAGIAIIHQELNLVPELTVAENIFLGREKLIGGLIVDRKASLTASGSLLTSLGIELDPGHVTAYAVIPVALLVWLVVRRVRSHHGEE